MQAVPYERFKMSPLRKTAASQRGLDYQEDISQPLYPEQLGVLELLNLHPYGL